MVVVATSNVEPDGLYRDGLNRALFLPFIKLLGERNDVVALDARADYRLQKLTRAPVYYCPADARAEQALDAAFLDMTGAPRGEPVEIELLGRALHVPQAVDGVARFSFDELCRRPLAAVDYLALARALPYARRRPHPAPRRPTNATRRAGSSPSSTRSTT